MTLMRAPVSGGPPQVVLTAAVSSDYQCARLPATMCVLGEQRPDRKQLAFIAFDPVGGRERELMTIDTDPNTGYNWDLSLDGSRLAIAKSGEVGGHVQIRLLSDRSIRDVKVKGWARVDSLYWAPDGKGFFTSSSSPLQGETLLYTELEGNEHVLWTLKGHRGSWGLPSPDGRHLAVLDEEADQNAWMIEDF